MTTALEVQGLSKRYADTVAVDSFSHSFKAGAITTIVGPSGSGKSTLLWMIAGLTPADDGGVLLDGEEISARAAEKRDIGMVFQSYALFPHLTVRENVEFGLRVRGIRRADRAARANETLELVRMSSLGDRRISQLSGGEQQRVALARALAFRPKVLLMDEPLSALDAKLRDELRAELFKLLAELRLTTVYVTHDQVEAMGLGEELIVMRSGRIEQAGAPLDVYLRPGTPFVADFLGSANIVEGMHHDGSVQLPFATLRVPQALPAGACWMMVRPEDIEIAKNGDVQFHGRVESTFFLGNQLRLGVVAGAHRLIVDVRNDVRFASDEVIPLRIRTEKACFWPKPA
jgi:putative spermidine/putrescine transport system ATP-binding protein